MMCLAFLSFIPLSYAEPVAISDKIVIASNSDIDFSTLPNLADHAFVINKASFEAMNSGQAQLLLSDKKWTDEQMADYKQRHKNLPLVLTIAAFSDLKSPSLEQQAEVFSGRTGDKILFLYMTALTSDPVREALALHFSETTQGWFSEHDLMVIPEVIQQQNRVELGLLEPQFLGGYK